MQKGERFFFKEGDVLHYESDSQTEKFEVIKIVEGQYKDSRTGTCSKSPANIYEYQVVYMKPTDSLSQPYDYFSTHWDDCQYYPTLREHKLIQTMNGSFQDDYEQIIWLNEFDGHMNSYRMKHSSLALGNRTFDAVYEYVLAKGQRMAKLYYTKHYGFVGYQLKDGTLFVLAD